MQLPKPYKIHASQVEYKNGAQRYKKQPERVKKIIEIGRQVMKTVVFLSNVDAISARNLEHSNALHNTCIEHKHIIQGFYYS